MSWAGEDADEIAGGCAGVVTALALMVVALLLIGAAFWAAGR